MAYILSVGSFCKFWEELMHKKSAFYAGFKYIKFTRFNSDLSYLDESVSKINELLKVLRVQGARTGLNDEC